MTRSNLGALLAVLGLALTAPVAASAEDVPAKKWYEELQVSGFVDLYYSDNFNRPLSRSNTFNGGLSNFDFEHNAVSLNAAELVLAKAPGPVGFRLDLDFGPTTEFVHCGLKSCSSAIFESPEAPYRNLQQAYVTYAAPFATFDFGKFVTHMGAEVIESKDNWNYTRSLLFAYAIPYYHAGARVNVPLGDMAYVNGYLYNGWNNVVENNATKTGGLAIGVTPVKQVSAILNWVGPENVIGLYTGRQVYDAIVAVNPTDALSFMVNYDYGVQKTDNAAEETQKFSGVALYARLKVDPCALALRYEILNDTEGVMLGVPHNHIQEFTATAERMVKGGLLTRVEFRHDQAHAEIFETSDGGARDKDNRLILSGVFLF